MKLYVWRSDACANYGRGTVGVVAESVDAARGLAREALIDWLRREKVWLWDSDCADELRDKLAQVEADISADPAEALSCVVEGSE